ncbi:MAG: 6-bladed beta-propeller [Candidatus Zhuqueibacterota bacterium]
MRIVILLLSLFIILRCSTEKPTTESPLSAAERKKISAAKCIDDIFEKTSEVQLSTGADHAISLVTDMKIDSSGNFIIADGWQSKAVFIFGPDGRFVKELGRQGQGPGEYSTPVSLALNSAGDIFVVDYLNNRINIYGKDYAFKRSIIPKSRIKHFIHINHLDELFMYSGELHPFKKDIYDTIHKYDGDGKTLISFAPFPEEVLEVKMMASQNGVAIDDNNYIYEMNPLLYKIRKYSSDGKLINSFTRETSLFKIVTDENESPIIVYGPYYLEKGLIMAKVNKHLEIYDIAGNFLAGDLPFDKEIAYTRGNSFYVEQWDEGTEEQFNPKIIQYLLKLF